MNFAAVNQVGIDELTVSGAYIGGTAKTIEVVMLDASRFTWEVLVAESCAEIALISISDDAIRCGGVYSVFIEFCELQNCLLSFHTIM